ncbi:hypothetical protein [Thiothrix subterranea]|uniref:Uncharacterized protein n=2 Tax=Thiothrix subterranea TaxID=2735563 RepID=A0ABU0Y564_9GAMM|nr:hypothetical protein [Thiothrix subterranea]MDQ5767925.1 hypothetical protein [Thiothrix subterranea]
MNNWSGASSSELPEMALDGMLPAVQAATWHLPGYRRIEARHGDGQYVTCGDTFPCADPTPKSGGGNGDTEYGYVYPTDGQPLL